MPTFTFDGDQWTEEELAAVESNWAIVRPLLEFNRIKGPTMSPPRRPKGESPRTTIRFLQRQIANLQSSCNVYHGMIQDRDKQIARQDVELSEAADAERLLASEAKVYSEKYGALLGAYQNQALRLQFLEGYYHAKRETFPAGRAGNQGAHSDGAAVNEEGREKGAAERDAGTAGGQIRGFRPNHPAPDNRRPMEGEKEEGWPGF